MYSPFILHTHAPSLQILFSAYSESEETLGILTSKFESTELFLFHIEDCIERQWVLSMLQCLALVCEFVLSWLLKQIKKNHRKTLEEHKAKALTQST